MKARGAADEDAKSHVGQDDGLRVRLTVAGEGFIRPWA